MFSEPALEQNRTHDILFFISRPINWYQWECSLVSSLRPPKHFASFRGFSVFISVFSFSKIPFPFLLVPIGEFREYFSMMSVVRRDFLVSRHKWDTKITTIFNLSHYWGTLRAHSQIAVTLEYFTPPPRRSSGWWVGTVATHLNRTPV